MRSPTKATCATPAAARSTKPPPKRPRRTQAERTATTRRKLIEAAIEILAESGYGAASTTAVADRAGVSRGSIFHNFPSKADLMLAVLDHVFEEDVKFYDQHLEGVSSGREYARIMSRISWEVFSGPRGIAVLQIQLGGAADPELKPRLPKGLLQVSQRAADSQQRRYPVGPAMKQLRTASSRVHVAALRGLTMGLIAGEKPEDLAAELELLQRYAQFAQDVLAPQAAARDRAEREKGET
ncbi:TetR/AcrR family transcriptional regulator [Phenylobacterium sp.]|uniref:TetR/AcrR family transcriptional regulator n=1 Tax=Phenylobacterium sp. TaxID=1871053 RepID=UPI0025E998B1|nr:TetR/AcrR family transcriptional regulator [Phenylobacterium sp.]MBX3484707.1 TetR/AcrR family transcriptional regulator [Phenylobacterium sp.]